MSWIESIPYEKAKGQLKKLYDRVKAKDNTVDNVLKVHSLRPHTLGGHMGLYKSVLHHSNNKLPKWYLETIGVYVSYINKCDYCIQHHIIGLKRQLNDDQQWLSIKDKFEKGIPEKHFSGKLLQGLRYARRLTKEPQTIHEQDIEDMRLIGFTDGEILEVNQVTAYFNYVNRTVTGLGVNAKGDELGLSPNDSDDDDNWNHQ